MVIDLDFLRKYDIIMYTIPGTPIQAYTPVKNIS